MKIVITGGAGFIGSYLIDALVSMRVGEIWVVDNFYRGNIEFLKRHVHNNAIKLIEGDIRDKNILDVAFKNASLIYHLAAQSNVLGAFSDPDYSFSTNVHGTLNVLRQADKAGVSRIVFSSSREVYGEVDSLPVHENTQLVAKNPYGASKIAAEAYCRIFNRENLEIVILRLANVYGPRDTERVIPLFIVSLLQDEPLFIYGKNKILDFIWIDDVVDVLVQAGVYKKGIQQPVNVGTGVGTKLTQLAYRLVELTESNSKVNITPSREFEVTGFIANVGRMHSLFRNSISADPLCHLEAVVEYWKDVLRKGDLDKQSYDLSRKTYSHLSESVLNPGSRSYT